VCQSGAQSESSRRQLGLRVRGVEFFSWPLGPCWPLIQSCYWSEELCDTVTTTHPRQQPHRRSVMLEERQRERDVECQCTVLNESVRNSYTSDLAKQSTEAWRSVVKTDTEPSCSTRKSLPSAGGNQLCSTNTRKKRIHTTLHFLVFSCNLK